MDHTQMMHTTTAAITTTAYVISYRFHLSTSPSSAGGGFIRPRSCLFRQHYHQSVSVHSNSDGEQRQSKLIPGQMYSMKPGAVRGAISFIQGESPWKNASHPGTTESLHCIIITPSMQPRTRITSTKTRTPISTRSRSIAPIESRLGFLGPLEGTKAYIPALRDVLETPTDYKVAHTALNLLKIQCEKGSLHLPQRSLTVSNSFCIALIRAGINQVTVVTGFKLLKDQCPRAHVWINYQGLVVDVASEELVHMERLSKYKIDWESADMSMDEKIEMVRAKVKGEGSGDEDDAGMDQSFFKFLEQRQKVSLIFFDQVIEFGPPGWSSRGSSYKLSEQVPSDSTFEKFGAEGVFEKQEYLENRQINYNQDYRAGWFDRMQKRHREIINNIVATVYVDLE